MKSVSAFVYAATLCVAVAAASLAHGQARLGDRPFMRSLDGSISARLNGPACADTVEFNFTGPDTGVFNQDRVATRLMNNVVSNIRDACPRAQLVVAKGMAAGRVVYNAIAERDSNWLLLELGGAQDASLFAAGARGQSGDQAAFLRQGTFAGFPAVLQAMRGQAALCAGSDGSTCTASMEFQNASEAGATVVSRTLVQEDGTQATLTYLATNTNGLLCGNPQQATINISGGSSSPAVRQRFATDLRARLEPYGSRVCTGFSTRTGGFDSANFGEDGARQGNVTTMTLSATAPRLRQGS